MTNSLSEAFKAAMAKPAAPAAKPYTTGMRRAWDFVHANPGKITKVIAAGAGLAENNAAALLLDMYNRNMVTRQPVPAGGAKHVTSYVYTTAIPEYKLLPRAKNAKPIKRVVRMPARVHQESAAVDHGPTTRNAASADRVAEELVSNMTVRIAQAVYNNLHAVFGRRG